MIRRTTICALIMFAVCAFFAVDKANAQAVYGTTIVTIDPNTRQLYGYHATEVDDEAWWYYVPAVEGFILDQSENVLDSAFEVDNIGQVADVETQFTYQPGKTYYVISDHYVGMIIYEPPPTGGGPAYWNPFGFGFSGPGGYNPLWSFFPFTSSPGYRTVQYIYLGTTGFRLDFFGEPHISQMSPTSAQLDSNIELHFEGTNLGGNPSVNISGSGVSTGQIIFSNETRLSLNISIAANATPGNRSVSISTRGYTSNSVTLTIGDRTPHINSLNPSRGDAGSVVNVTISGRNFGINPAIFVSGGITAEVLAGSTTTQINSRFTIPSGTLAGDKQVTVFSNGLNGS
ncbi:MAG TPA: IPT/TIG domain-containing protein, partial [Pyrinomonadaceae bacterium]